MAYLDIKRTNINSDVINIAEQHAKHHNFPAFDSTYFASHIFWLCISFGLFYIFISKVVVPLVGLVLEIRHDRIAADLDNAARLKSEAENLKTNSDKIIDNSYKEFKAIVARAKEKARLDNEEDRKQTETILAARLSESVESVAALKTGAERYIVEIANEIAPILVKTLVKR